MHISVHGLIRAANPEIGRDTDTGGQIRYLADLLAALDGDARIRRCDLLTRKVVDHRVSPDYAEDFDIISEKSRICRVACGPRGYLRKEALWPHIPVFVDGVISFIRSQEDIPDVIHAHYADAGLVAARVSKVTGIPIVFTGHSLGRYKLDQLLARGMARDRAEARFHFKQRVEAEEETIENASLVIAGTRTEIATQYMLYDHIDLARTEVVPPGCDIARFVTKADPAAAAALKAMLARFLTDPAKPALIVLSRPDPQKNVAAAVRVFGESRLRDRANLVLLLGGRDDIRSEPAEQRRLLQEVLYLIDRYDLYGHVAYPKTHTREVATALYHHAARTRGLLMAFSRHENFGLTLVEAAAAGLPVVSSGAGGMTEVLERCGHGIVVNPEDPEAGVAVGRLLADRAMWAEFSRRGRASVVKHYQWRGHVDHYLSLVRKITAARRPSRMQIGRPKPIATSQYMLVCDIDDTLTGDLAAVARLNAFIGRRTDVAFGVATGRSLDSARAVLGQWGIVEPRFFITSVGTEIHLPDLGPREDATWRKHIQFRWNSSLIRAALAQFPGLEPQEDEAQTDLKVSYYRDGANGETAHGIKTLLRRNQLYARVIVTKGRCIDVLPMRASKGHAVRHLALRWRFDLSQVLTAGDAGNDTDMLQGNTRGIVVGNHSGELEILRGDPAIYFSSKASAAGVLDGLRHHGLC